MTDGLIALGVLFGGFLITRHDDVRAVLRDDAQLSRPSNARAIGIVMGRTIVEMDDREPLKHRNLVTPALAPRSLVGVAFRGPSRLPVRF